MIIEIATLKIKPGIDAETVIKATEKTQPFMEKQPAYISRELLKLADDSWVDLVYWTNLEGAKQAGKALMAEPVCQDFVKILDPAGVKVQYYAPVRSWHK